MDQAFFLFHLQCKSHPLRRQIIIPEFMTRNRPVITANYINAHKKEEVPKALSLDKSSNLRRKTLQNAAS